MSLYAILRWPIGRLRAILIPDDVVRKQRHRDIKGRDDYDRAAFQQRVHDAHLIPTDCTRKPYHVGPCNGWAKDTCGVNASGKAASDRNKADFFASPPPMAAGLNKRPGDPL